MEKHTLGGLKKILVTAEDFHDIQDYFYTIAETNRQALLGKEVKNKMLKDLVSVAIAQIKVINGTILPGEKLQIIKWRLYEVTQRYFYHGSGALPSGEEFMVLYFADIDKGLLDFMDNRNKSANLVRISAKAIKDAADPRDAFSAN